MANSPPNQATKTKLHDNVVCPFCSLLCSDLKVAVSPDQLKVQRSRCRRAESGYNNAVAHGTSQVAGADASLPVAIDAASKLLNTSHRPAFGGLGSDIDGIRVLVKAAERCGAVVDHMHSDSIAANIAVMQTLGGYTTTLSEIKNRADLVIIVGADCKNHYARFVEKFLEPSAALAPNARKQRKIVYIGPSRGAPSSSKLPIEKIRCETADLALLLSTLRAGVLGKSIQTKDVAGVSSKKMASVATALNAASYASIVWAPKYFEPTQARLCIETISRITADLNQHTRAAGLSLGGDDGGISALNVTSWLSGFPLRVSFADGTPNYDPHLNRIDRLIDDGEIDCLVWVDAFGNSKLPTIPADLPLIYIGHPKSARKSNAQVTIPVGLPGIHHSARLTRTDSVVTVPLKRIQPNALPTVQSVVEAIFSAP